MSLDWSLLCDGSDFKIQGSEISVAFPDDRSHKVLLQESDDEYLLTANVARRALVATLPDLAISVWQRNRTVSLMGFRIDKLGRLIAESCVPKNGLTASEFQFYVRHLAIEADRLEYILSGSDTH
jgi:hypothetical protein